MANPKDTSRTTGAAGADQKNMGQGQAQQARKPQQNMQGGNPGGAATNIREHMTVVGSCGNRVGVVDHLEGSAIKLTRNDSKDGQHHFIPVGWVDRVDNEVHLKKNSMDAQRDWKSDASEC